MRLNAHDKIVAHIIDTTAKEFHAFLRRPIQVLVDMLEYCGYLTVVEDSLDEPVVVGKDIVEHFPPLQVRGCVHKLPHGCLEPDLAATTSAGPGAVN